MHIYTFRIFIITSLVSIVFTGCQALQRSEPVSQKDQYVIMLSMDGFRWDYPQMADMPNLAAIAASGVRAESMQPSFPANTFPNHYTIATGLYPINHGIVNNSFYDPDRDLWYSMGNTEMVTDGKFYGGEPIWVTAEKQGLPTASYFWVGSEADIQGITPSITKKYDGKVLYESRIDSVIAWLELPEERRPRLIMWYMDQPDGYGHDYGPDSEEVLVMLARLDSLLGVFTAKIEKLPIADQINLLFTSDHGMSATEDERVEYVDDFVNPDWLEKSSYLMFDPKEGYEDSVLWALNSMPHVTAWMRDNIPERLHYQNSNRTYDILGVRDIQWTAAKRSWNREDGFHGGTHGYDPKFKDMHSIFYAKGPAFRSGYVHPTFQNIHIYSLVAQILKLNPAPNDGSLEVVEEMLKPQYRP